MSSRFILIILSLFLLLFSELANGQRLPGRPRGGEYNEGPAQNSHVVKDTSDIFYFFADNINVLIPFSDSLLENFQHYDPARQGDFDYANLGNLGTASRPLFYSPAFRRGFDVGLHQYDLYQLRTSDLRFYKLTQAFTQAAFSQGTTQNDVLFQVKFSRSFARGLNLSLESKQINNAGAYDNLRVKNSNTGAGLWYHNKDGWYDGFISFVSNAIDQENSGGIAETLIDTIIPPFQIDVNLQTSMTRIANKEFAYTHYFNFNKWKNRPPKVKQRLPFGPPSDTIKRDSIAPVLLPYVPVVDSLNESARAGLTLETDRLFRRNFTFYHQATWRTESFKLYDTKPDTNFYGDFLVDGRGLRLFVETKKLENTFRLMTFKLRQDGKAFVEGDLLEIGLIHSLHFVSQEPLIQRTYNNLFLIGKLNFSPGDRMKMETYGHLGVGANSGDFRLQGNLYLDFRKIGRLQVEVINQLYSPSLLHEQLFIASKEIWKNNFHRTLETSISGTYTLPALSFSATGHYHLISNLIYFDSLAQPKQSGAISVFQLVFRKNFQFGSFYLDNWVGLQQSTSEVLQLPEVYTKHSLYFQRKIFKKVMLAKTGIDARFNTSYKAPSYHPLTGQFFLQDHTELSFTPLVDAFISFQVKTFRFFYKIENTLSFLTKDYYYQTVAYPLPFGFNNGGSRFGISWRLVD